MEERRRFGDTRGSYVEMYTEATNRFTGSARSFMEHVHLLTDAWTAYQRSDDGWRRASQTVAALSSLMGRQEQVVNNHPSEPVLDKKRPELVKDDSARTGSEAMGTSRVLP